MSTSFFIAVHVGAGYHARHAKHGLRELMRRACNAAAVVLKEHEKNAAMIANETIRLAAYFFS